MGLISDSWKQVKSEEARKQDAAVKALICLCIKMTVSGKSMRSLLILDTAKKKKKEDNDGASSSEFKDTL